MKTTVLLATFLLVFSISCRLHSVRSHEVLEAIPQFRVAG